MLKDKLFKNSGFTLIEVVIVLAIAGLIFVIVLLAVGQAQQARRDTQRKNDVNRLSAQLEQFASNNQGRYPSGSDFTNSASTFRSSYVDTLTFEDPSTGQYNFQQGTPNCSNPGDVFYQIDSNRRNYTLTMCLESGLSEITNQ